MTTNDDSSIRSGTILNAKYRVDEVIGAGGMGAVYRATHTVINRPVAIKTLHAEFVTNDSVVKRFHQEAQLAGSIGHDNICEVTDVGTAEDGSTYLVMPLLKGASLTDVLKTQRPLPFSRIVDMISQTLSALQAAHKAQIVHRDLKPDNIFVTRVGDRDDFVKLLDFGISKVLDQDSVSNLTRTGTVLGTPFYMAPEQARGSKDVDHRADIYAIGVILYEALTGKKPFEGDSYNEVMFKILAEPYATPRSLNNTIPKALDHIVLKAMARDPSDRYSSSEEMRLALTQWNADEAVTGAALTCLATDESVPGIPLPGVNTNGSISVSVSNPAAVGDRTPSGLVTDAQLDAAVRKSSIKMFIFGVAAVLLVAIAAVAWLQLTNRLGSNPSATVPLSAPALVPDPALAPAATNLQAVPVPVTDPPQVPVAVPSDDSPDTEDKADLSAKKRSKKKRKKKSSAAEETASSVKTTSPAAPSAAPQVETPAEPKKRDLKGRFGTKIVSDYED